MEQNEDRNATVIRDGEATQISVYDLLVGDILKIDTGDSIPCDCILLTGSSVTCDESNLTGEPDHLHKSSIDGLDEFDSLANPFLLSNSTVQSGTGMAVICAVGTYTQSGKAAKKLDIEAEKTPLQGKLETIANQIGLIGFYCALLTMTACTINMTVTKLVTGVPLMTGESLKSLISFLIIGITIVVVAVPEGLPLAVTISLAFSVGQMKEEKNLVRRLDASETMGGADQICSDKTGTLTMNKMDVVDMYMEGHLRGKDISEVTENTKNVFFQLVARNSNANLVFDKKKKVEVRGGNQTECGLLVYIRDNHNVSYESIRSAHKSIFDIPFSS